MGDRTEIERRPGPATRYRAALDGANILDRDDPRWRAALDACMAVRDEARAAVTGGLPLAAGARPGA
ncbi:hypothetical protein M1P56_21810 [Streptomyces sp. HU2014]|uniref:hypothetical protein n=1 Tax=Streptomyces sp. HU2014 TaxID=2939414 RepID=UPI00200E7298|nr:hypothetical protein [Streptomyces sp. HU2014]UQI46796.1 hypothetical protein M1P56_21810 [Streptomyces sp. HU2014]